MMEWNWEAVITIIAVVVSVVEGIIIRNQNKKFNLLSSVEKRTIALENIVENISEIVKRHQEKIEQVGEISHQTDELNDNKRYVLRTLDAHGDMLNQHTQAISNMKLKTVGYDEMMKQIQLLPNMNYILEELKKNFDRLLLKNENLDKRINRIEVKLKLNGFNGNNGD